MPRRSSTVAVITCDIIESSRYSPGDRRRLDALLRAAFRETERTFKKSIHTPIGFRITAGDEFQFVIADVSRALDILTYLRAIVATARLRPMLRFRASIGIGEIAVVARRNSYEADGTAFARAREGLKLLYKGKGPERWTSMVTGQDDKDKVADAILCLTDYFFARWTSAQWGAVRWAILGLTRQLIARKLRIAWGIRGKVNAIPG